MQYRVLKLISIISMVMMMQACARISPKNTILGPESARLSPTTQSYYDLISLPKPKGRIVASIYGFRDQTGQYQPAPASSFSTSVTQGATSLIIQAMQDSEWFIPLEREGLQNLLTERKIIRANLKKQGYNDNDITNLDSSRILFEGSIVGYDTNIRTGGAGAKYLGIGAHTKYRVDQVTVNLRVVNVLNGHVLHSVLVSKTIVSEEVQAGVFKFIDYQELLESELGYTVNEPVQVAVRAAIETALIHIIEMGIDGGSWEVREDESLAHPILRKYKENRHLLGQL